MLKIDKKVEMAVDALQTSYAYQASETANLDDTDDVGDHCCPRSTF